MSKSDDKAETHRETTQWCPYCDGNGEVCDDCREPRDVCECESDSFDPLFVDCDVCGGSGEVPVPPEPVRVTVEPA